MMDVSEWHQRLDALLMIPKDMLYLSLDLKIRNNAFPLIEIERYATDEHGAILVEGNSFVVVKETYEFGYDKLMKVEHSDSGPV